ncbi:hypothetical protein C8J57DRAFT_1492172 [Mycena rebaudengoi]|nr:hypothetical protein C8J57DRAFT_1492172 [Mycena rebaudengoi]
MTCTVRSPPPAPPFTAACAHRPPATPAERPQKTAPPSHPTGPDYKPRQHRDSSLGIWRTRLHGGPTTRGIHTVLLLLPISVHRPTSASASCFRPSHTKKAVAVGGRRSAER